MSYRVTGRRVPAVHQPVDPERARREAEQAARLMDRAAHVPMPDPTPREANASIRESREARNAEESRARRPRSKRSRGRAKALTIRTSQAMHSILRRLALATGTSVNELVNAAVLSAYARAS